MKVVIFGHALPWTNVVNNSLLKDMPYLEDIVNITTIDKPLLEQYDVIIPLLEHHYFSLYQANFTKNVVMPSLNNIKTLNCKNEFKKFIIDNSLEQYVPKTYNKFNEFTLLPLILKRFNLNAGQGCYIVGSDEDKNIVFNNDEIVKIVIRRVLNIDNEIKEFVLNTLLKGDNEKLNMLLKGNDILLKNDNNIFDLLNGENNYNLLEEMILGKYVIQDYIINPIEDVTYIVFKDGNILEHVSYKYNYNSNNYIKRAIYNSDHDKITKIVLEQKYLDVFKDILCKLNYFGVCNFNYKIDNGNIKIFEINPRLGGTLMLEKKREDLVMLLNSMVTLFNN